MTGQDDRQLTIQPESPLNPVTMVFAEREVVVYSIFDNELDSLSSPFNSTNLAFFGIAAGAGVTLLATLLAVDTISDKLFATFVAATIVAGFFAAFFGIQAFRDWRESSKAVTRIKERQGRAASVRASVPHTDRTVEDAQATQAHEPEG